MKISLSFFLFKKISSITIKSLVARLCSYIATFHLKHHIFDRLLYHFIFL